MRFNLFIITALFVFSAIPSTSFGQNRVVVIPLMEGDEDLLPGNICKGVTILGVTGSARCLGKNVDLDNDGYVAADCIDTNPNVHPGAPWSAHAVDPGNGFDWDCSGFTEKSVYGSDAVLTIPYDRCIGRALFRISGTAQPCGSLQGAHYMAYRDDVRWDYDAGGCARTGNPALVSAAGFVMCR